MYVGKQVAGSSFLVSTQLIMNIALRFYTMCTTLKTIGTTEFSVLNLQYRKKNKTNK